MVCVIDKDAATTAEEWALAEQGFKVVVLDDIGRSHDCDLVINPGRAEVLAEPSFALV